MLPVATAMPDDTPMFDPSILHELDWSENTAVFSPSISPSEPGDGLVMRPLCTADVNRGRILLCHHHKQKWVLNYIMCIPAFSLIRLGLCVLSGLGYHEGI